jgi:hypothetical protein
LWVCPFSEPGEGATQTSWSSELVVWAVQRQKRRESECAWGRDCRGLGA